MKSFHMVEEHNRALDLDRITIKLILSLGSKNNSSRGTVEEIIMVKKRTQSFEDQLLYFMSENKRILNLHEKNFAELENFQANTTVFQTNTNATMRNLETQVGQLALSLQSQSRNAFPSSTEINPKDLTPTTLRSNDELQGSKKV